MTGSLPQRALATDLALTVTERLRKLRLAGKFVEFFGPGVSTLSCGERAVLANMAPEYGASCGFFAVDERTLEYLHTTGRPKSHVQLVEAYCKRQRLWFEPEQVPRYTDIVDIDLGGVEVSIAGPHRPQDRLRPSDTVPWLAGHAKPGRTPALGGGGPPDGAVAIAAITSCTNTSDPRLMAAAGLLARKARLFRLRPPTWVKTSLAPGSPAAESYLRRSGLLEDLDALGFGIVGFGCTTCIGNSGSLVPEMVDSIERRGVLPVAVLSGNRNFPGRVHPQIEASFLASPPLVIAYALAGHINLDILRDQLGRAPGGQVIRLADIWPTGTEIDAVLAASMDPADISTSYEQAENNEIWRGLEAPRTALFPWNEASTYIRRPPFASRKSRSRLGSYRAHPLLVLGDDTTTDHISPAGQVPPKSAAADYLIARGEDRKDLNVFAARRGNWEVMLLGLYTNRSIRNLLDPSLPAGSTIHAGSGAALPLWQAAERYASEGTSLVVVAGERYGTGSSRDWAAKGLWLLGVRAVLALSFERIHRSNLIGMGILPLRLPAECGPLQLALTARDTLEIKLDPAELVPGAAVRVSIQRAAGSASAASAMHSFIATAAIETALEVQLLLEGGILPHILRHNAQEGPDM